MTQRVLYILGAMLLTYVLFGCSTTVYKNGQPVFRTYSDARNITYQDGYFHADLINHSKHTQTVFDGVAKDVTAVGGSTLLLH